MEKQNKPNFDDNQYDEDLDEYLDDDSDDDLDEYLDDDSDDDLDEHLDDDRVKKFETFYNSLTKKEQKRYVRDQSKHFKKMQNDIEKSEHPTKHLFKKIALFGIPTIIVIASILITFLAVLPNVNYNKGMTEFEAGNYEKALHYFESSKILKKAKRQLALTNAEIALASGDKKSAALYYGSVEEDQYYQKSKKLFWNEQFLNNTITYVRDIKAYVAITNDGKIKTSEIKPNMQYNYKFDDWDNIVEIKADYDIVAGLKKDGTIHFSNENLNRTYIKAINWKNIVSIQFKDGVLIGLKADGTINILGNKKLKNIVSSWKNIVDLSLVPYEYHANYDITTEYEIIAVTSDGKVKYANTVDDLYNITTELDKLSNVKNVSATHSVAYGLVITTLFNDGTAKTTPNTLANITEWKNIREIKTFGKFVCGITYNNEIAIAGEIKEDDVQHFKNLLHITDLDTLTIIDQDGNILLSKYETSEIKDWDNLLIPSTDR